MVEAALRRTLNDGDLLLDVEQFKIYNYSGGQLRYLPYAVGVALGADQGSAKRMPHSSLAGYSYGPDIGNYATSWNYGGADRVVNTDAGDQRIGPC